jgi:uncharacterized protein YjbI with pentapeptide repeats
VLAVTDPHAPRVCASPSALNGVVIEDEDEWRDVVVDAENLAGVVAEHARVTGSVLRNVTLTGAELHRAALTDVRFVDCELSGAILTESDWLRVELVNCRMSGLVLSESRLRDVRVVDGKLDTGDFRLSRCERIVFAGCAMPNADFYGATLDDVRFDRSDLRAAHFSGVHGRDLRLLHCNVEGVSGATALAGASVTPDQMLPLGLAVLAELGFTIFDDEGG